jgi:hypothetical protein
MAKIAAVPRAGTLVHATASGRRYVVEFDDQGEIVTVCALVQRRGSVGPHERVTWDRRFGTPMTITAACAGRAAVKQLQRRRDTTQ